MDTNTAMANMMFNTAPMFIKKYPSEPCKTDKADTQQKHADRFWNQEDGHGSFSV